jgi:hypothetical protein
LASSSGPTALEMTTVTRLVMICSRPVVRARTVRA